MGAREAREDVTVEVREQHRTPLWRNATFLKWLAQLGVLAAVVALFAVLGAQALKNFNQSGISFGWKWLSDPPGISIREGIDTLPDSGVRAIVVGMVNTLRVGVSGILAATILGTLIGIGRLSKNWIVNKLSTVYVESIRNVPLLLQIFFWQALAITLPSLTEADVGTYWFKASNKGFALAWVRTDGGFWPWLLFVLVGLAVARRVFVRRLAHMEATGEETHPILTAIGVVVAFAVVGWFAWPLLRPLAGLWHGLASLFRALPPIVYPAVVALAAVVGAAWWIRSFFESRRTPAGFGKLTDDDWFRVVFAVVAGLAVAAVAFVVGGFELLTPAGDRRTIAELVGIGIANVLDWFGRAFEVTDGTPLVGTRPRVEVRGAGFVNFSTDGIVMSVPFFAVWTGVTLYTASFIAEIVRGGILAVPKGQTEASMALGFRRSQYLRLVILPQAFRIILPPMGNQYLNLMKNTSLGIAVAFPEIIAVGTTILNQTGQSLPVVLVWMGFFLSLSLGISAIVNYYNRKMKIKER
ncbi:MAG TPA: ABC transporter permease subunit [Actinobacteria bacterium]|nr:ABC transporter permease subunit [Actinomycetota bacterium]